MSFKQIAFCLIAVAATAFGGRAAMANFLSTSASGFQPLTPADAPYVQHVGYGVYSTDTSTSRSITAPLGLPFIEIDSGPIDFTFHAAVYNPGGTLSCTAYLIVPSGSFSTYSGTNSTTTTGASILDVTVSLTATSGTTFAPSIVCTLPASNATTGNGTIFGVYYP